MACANGVAGAHPDVKLVVAPIIRPCRIETERVLTSSFVGYDIENFFDLTAPAAKAFGKQKRASTAAFGKCA